MRRLIAFVAVVSLLAFAGAAPTIKPSAKQVIDTQSFPRETCTYTVVKCVVNTYDPKKIHGVILRHQLVEKATFKARFAMACKPVEPVPRC